MPLLISDTGGSDFKILPQGQYVAICNMVVDVGIQDGGQYKNKQKLYIRWEIPDERVEWNKDGEDMSGPAVIGNFYTASLSEKSLLRPILEAWRGRAFTAKELAGFDIFSVLGKSCQLSVIHNEANNKTYANVKAVMALPKGMKPLVAENDLIKYSPGDEGQWEDLPEWLQKKINDGVKDEVELGEEPTDEVPF